jgi:hypothetical protein
MLSQHQYLSLQRVPAFISNAWYLLHFFSTTMSKQQPLSEAVFHKQRRSLLRKKTRAGWGVGISGVMSVSGLPYMAVPAGIAAYGYHNSGATLEDLEQIMAAHGIKPRSRDRLTSFLTGTAEKLALSAVLLGHDEALCLNGVFGLDLAELNQEVMEHSASGEVNEFYNGPVEFAQDVVGEGAGIVPTMVVVGGTAGAVEYATGRLGDAGSNMRNKMQTGESQEALWQRMGVPRR